MATLAAAAARQARALTRVSSPQSAATLIQRRGLAGAADHHGPPKVNCWSDPMSPSKWKEEHFVIVSLSGWGLLFFGGYKFFTRGKGKKDEEIRLLHFEAPFVAFLARLRNLWKHHNELSCGEFSDCSEVLPVIMYFLGPSCVCGGIVSQTSL
ncbi:hypothetical protein SDJN02_27494 [Cucurbita argyrosperma subsp. argyrosperma]|nr:hypothetical protein SDJN02_27494 [Cucurbita argyrosperma subsp. argyrosperma]